jgi:hypothetical protein
MDDILRRVFPPRRTARFQFRRSAKEDAVWADTFTICIACFSASLADSIRITGNSAFAWTSFLTERSCLSLLGVRHLGISRRSRSTGQFAFSIICIMTSTASLARGHVMRWTQDTSWQRIYCMHDTWPNKPAAPNPAIASRFKARHHWCGVGEPGRSASRSHE